MRTICSVLVSRKPLHANGSFLFMVTFCGYLCVEISCFMVIVGRILVLLIQTTSSCSNLLN